MVRKINLKESITDKWTRDTNKDVYCLESDNYNAYLYVLADQSCPGIQIESEIINNKTGKAEKRFSVGDWSLEKTLPVAKKKAEAIIAKLNTIKESTTDDIQLAKTQNVTININKLDTNELKQLQNIAYYTLKDMDLVDKIIKRIQFIEG